MIINILNKVKLLSVDMEYRNHCILLLLLLLQISMISGAPLLHWLQPNQITPIQQQLLELQAMQQYYPISPLSMDTLTNQPQPIIIILPEEQTKSDANVDPKNGHQYDQQLKAKTKDEDDSVVIDAEPIPTIDGRKAIIMLPNGRFSIGDFISAIPFLPIEINVPDTISWIGSGISGIISGIGQRLPFRRPTPNTVSDILADANIDDMKTNAQYNPVIVKPLVMLPFGGKRLIFPTQF